MSSLCTRCAELIELMAYCQLRAAAKYRLKAEKEDPTKPKGTSVPYAQRGY